MSDKTIMLIVSISMIIGLLVGTVVGLHSLK